MKKPIFIVGSRRSGTTLLCLMLDSHTKLSMTYETGLIDALYRRKDSYGDLNSFQNIDNVVRTFYEDSGASRWRKGTLPSTEQVVNYGPCSSVPEIIDNICSIIAENHNKQRWGDKSPDFIHGMETLAEMFPDAQFIHIIRDCRDVVMSRLGIRWFSHDIPRIARDWVNCIQTGKVIGGKLGPNRYTEIRYEDLLCRPAQELQRVCNFIGEKFEEEMLTAYQQNSTSLLPEDEMNHHGNTMKPIMPTHKDLWRTKMSNSNRKIIESIAGDMLLNMGYECLGTDGKVWKIMRWQYIFNTALDRFMKRSF